LTIRLRPKENYVSSTPKLPGDLYMLPHRDTITQGITAHLNASDSVPFSTEQWNRPHVRISEIGDSENVRPFAIRRFFESFEQVLMEMRIGRLLHVVDGAQRPRLLSGFKSWSIYGVISPFMVYHLLGRVVLENGSTHVFVEYTVHPGLRADIANRLTLLGYPPVKVNGEPGQMRVSLYNG
jgi:hypothetical protein